MASCGGPDIFRTGAVFGGTKKTSDSFSASYFVRPEPWISRAEEEPGSRDEGRRTRKGERHFPWGEQGEGREIPRLASVSVEAVEQSGCLLAEEELVNVPRGRRRVAQKKQSSMS